MNETRGEEEEEDDDELSSGATPSTNHLPTTIHHVIHFTDYTIDREEVHLSQVAVWQGKGSMGLNLALLIGSMAALVLFVILLLLFFLLNNMKSQTGTTWDKCEKEEVPLDDSNNSSPKRPAKEWYV